MGADAVVENSHLLCFQHKRAPAVTAVKGLNTSQQGRRSRRRTRIGDKSCLRHHSRINETMLSPMALHPGR